ncbi:MAG: hypothetical protein AB7F66_11090 [Bacteriovoracia bacterium]
MKKVISGFSYLAKRVFGIIQEQNALAYEQEQALREMKDQYFQKHWFQIQRF